MASADKLSLGLDDIIRAEGSTRRRGSGGAIRGSRGRGGGGGRGGSSGSRTRGGGGIPRSNNAPARGQWQHDLFEDNGNRNRGAQRSTGVNSTTKLLVSNLDYGVTTDDIQELFAEVGAVRVARVHYDQSGQSLGTAEVVFERRVDAVAAQQKYNSLNLDGRPMDIRLVGGVDDGARLQSNRRLEAKSSGDGNQRASNRSNYQQGSSRSWRQQQNGTDHKKEVSADDLDAELDAYRAENKQKKQE